MKWKKNMVVRAWERCRGGGKKSSSSGKVGSCHELKNSKSRNCKTTRSIVSSMEESDHKGKKSSKCKLVAPKGCFSIYVGPQRQRFVIKTELVNHPLFVTLLEDAELEYGFNSEGPLLLPCDVDLFNKVLAEMDDNGDHEITPICSFACSSPLILSSPYRRHSSSINKGYGSYKLLTPSRLLKLNSY